MATQSKRQVAERVLEKLGVVQEESTVSAWQYNRAERAVEDGHAELGALAWWGVEETPQKIADAFAQYVAGMTADVFVGEARATYFASRMVEARRRIQMAAHQSDISGAPTRFEAY